jgi:protein-tyrosine kinase
MSRNFELLARLEAELGENADLKLPYTDRTPTWEFDSIIAKDTGRDEMLRLVQRVFLSSNGSVPRLVVFFGVQDGNGSTSVTANAARTLAANTSKSVCVVDGNLKSPRLAELLAKIEMTSTFRESTSQSKGYVQIGSNLWFGNPDVLSGDGCGLPPADTLGRRLAHLRETFEYVLIDAPATNVCEDAAVLSQLAGAAILVIDANHTRRITARKAKETLDAAGIRLLGTVLCDRLFPIPERLYRKL